MRSRKGEWLCEVARWTRNLGSFGRILVWIWDGLGVVLGLRGHHLGGLRRTWIHVHQKGGGGGFLNLPGKVGPGACPEDPKIGRSWPEERTKRLCEEKIVKTLKTSTMSSEMRVLSGREGPKILKNRPRSGLEGLKSSIVT